jgi:hypothetical protein
MPKCRKCTKIKAITEFSAKSKGWCRECKRESYTRNNQLRKEKALQLKATLIAEGKMEPEPIIPKGHNKCIVCKDIKLYQLFRKDIKCDSGYRNTCIECANRKKRQKSTNLKKTVGTHKCIKCKKIKIVKKFYGDKSRPDGLRDWCIDCCNDYKNNRYKKIPDEKECNTCRQTLPLISFAKNPSGRYYRANACKICRNINRRNKVYIRKINGSKICVKCKKTLSIKKFNSDKYNTDGLQTYCKECFKVVCQLSQKNLYNFCTQLFRGVKYSAKKRNIYVEITKQNIIDKYTAQCGKCIYTNHLMTTDRTPKGYSQRLHNINNISVDRIDSSKGYILDNIQLVCVGVNIVKTDLTENMMYKLCKNICNSAILKRSIYDSDHDYPYKLAYKLNQRETQNLKVYCFRVCSNMKHNALRRNLIVDITYADIIQQYIKQKGKCAYTMIQLTLNTPENNTMFNLSVDRIDSTEGYIKGNFHLVCNVVNIMKYDLIEKDFVNICNDICSTLKVKIRIASNDVINNRGYDTTYPALRFLLTTI